MIYHFESLLIGLRVIDFVNIFLFVIELDDVVDFGPDLMLDILFDFFSCQWLLALMRLTTIVKAALRL